MSAAGDKEVKKEEVTQIVQKKVSPFGNVRTQYMAVKRQYYSGYNLHDHHMAALNHISVKDNARDVRVSSNFPQGQSLTSEVYEERSPHSYNRGVFYHKSVAPKDSRSLTPSNSRQKLNYR
jgi:hypothetical protein